MKFPLSACKFLYLVLVYELRLIVVVFPCSMVVKCTVYTSHDVCLGFLLCGLLSLHVLRMDGGAMCVRKVQRQLHDLDQLTGHGLVSF